MARALSLSLEREDGEGTVNARPCPECGADMSRLMYPNRLYCSRLCGNRAKSRRNVERRKNPRARAIAARAQARRMERLYAGPMGVCPECGGRKFPRSPRCRSCDGLRRFGSHKGRTPYQEERVIRVRDCVICGMTFRQHRKRYSLTARCSSCGKARGIDGSMIELVRLRSQLRHAARQEGLVKA